MLQQVKFASARNGGSSQMLFPKSREHPSQERLGAYSKPIDQLFGDVFGVKNRRLIVCLASRCLIWWQSANKLIKLIWYLTYGLLVYHKHCETSNNKIVIGIEPLILYTARVTNSGSGKRVRPSWQAFATPDFAGCRQIYRLEDIVINELTVNIRKEPPNTSPW